MRIFSIFLLCTVFSFFAHSQNEKSPYLRLMTNGYAVIASPTTSITLSPHSETQISLTQHLILETDLLSEQIQVAYEYKGEKRFRTIMLSQKSAEPFLRFRAINRLIDDDSETVTIEMVTNVPDRVITDSKAFINGQHVNLKPNMTYTFTAYHPVSLIEGYINISNSSAPIKGKNRINHPFEPDTGCNLLDENKTFYALCFSNLSGKQSAQFFLNEQAVGKFGELRYVPAMIEDLSLVYSVGQKEFKYAITLENEGYILLLQNSKKTH